MNVWSQYAKELKEEELKRELRGSRDIKITTPHSFILLIFFSAFAFVPSNPA